MSEGEPAPHAARPVRGCGCRYPNDDFVPCGVDTLHRTVRRAAAESYPEAYRDLKEPADEVMIIVPAAEPAIILAGILWR